MRPLFTIHAGEYLVGLYIQKSLKLNAWIPAKDIGIDLLVTDSDNFRAVSLQVKYGKDFLPEMKAELRRSLRCVSWFTLNRAKLDTSQAQFWIFVLRGFEMRPTSLLSPRRNYGGAYRKSMFLIAETSKVIFALQKTTSAGRLEVWAMTC
jgi:hypothetical protein